MARARARSDEAKLLAKYRTMRDFGATPEPAGARRTAPRAGKRLRFVVQRHRASHLHYDFRLEAHGVLMSWAVPKGPTLRAGERRLAMQTEDHPLDYYDFEGVIPEGSYGAGDVIVWDWGDYELASGDDPYREMQRGKISFVLHGEKLRGRFALVKMRGRGGPKDNAWLLLKEHDEEAEDDYDVDEHAASVKSGRTNDEIAADENAARWESDRPATKQRRITVHASPRAARAPAKRDPLPSIVRPQLATLVDAPFDDDGWLFEIKWDGFRAICTVDARGKVALVSRNGKDLLARFPDLEDLAKGFSSRPLVIDGEIVALDRAGKSSFQRLQGSPAGTSFVAFDVLYANGRDLRAEPLEERKRVLEELVVPGGRVIYSKHVVGEGKKLYAFAREHELEGIVAKRRDARYLEKRTRDWLKIKVQLLQDCVVGGFTDPKGSRKGFGSLLLGAYTKKGGPLEYVGHVGTGFGGEMIAALMKKMAPLATTECPFATVPPARKRSHWIRPKLVAAVGFTEWTDDGKMRHPTFEGLRDDKSPAECLRELPLRAKERSR